MSNVLKLVRPSNVDTVSVLKGLLIKAMAGEVTGLALCYCAPDGAPDVAFTGVYAAHPDKALSATMRLFRTLEQQQDEARGML